jgi:hypothetical protein
VFRKNVWRSSRCQRLMSCFVATSDWRCGRMLFTLVSNGVAAATQWLETVPIVASLYKRGCQCDLLLPQSIVLNDAENESNPGTSLLIVAWELKLLTHVYRAKESRKLNTLPILQVLREERCEKGKEGKNWGRKWGCVNARARRILLRKARRWVDVQKVDTPSSRNWPPPAHLLIPDYLEIRDIFQKLVVVLFVFAELPGLYYYFKR